MGWSKNDIIKAARDLCYPKEVIQKLRKAKNDNELYLIMRTARETESRREYERAT